MTIVNCRALAGLTLLALLGGCASVPHDRGRAAADALVRAHGRAMPLDADPSLIVADLVREPLTADAAVRIALLRNPDLQVIYAELGLAAADLYEAGRPSNPRVSAAFLDSSVTGEQRTLGIAQSFTTLLLAPIRARLATGEFERVKRVVAHEILSLAAGVETAHVRLVADGQSAKMRALGAKAAQVSADLAQRFFEAGNISRLQLAREQAAASQAHLQSLSAQAQAAASRASLARAMGIDSAAWRTEPVLRVPLPVAETPQKLIARALESRLDLDAARRDVEISSREAALVRHTRWFGDIEVGAQRERETDGERLAGPTLALELPIFSRNTDKLIRAEALAARARSRVAALELDIAHEVTTAAAQVTSALARAEAYRTLLIPQREQIVARMQEELNFMLVGQFELLAAKQAEYEAYQGYIESVRDYWLARVDLSRATGGPLAGGHDQHAPPIPLPSPMDDAVPHDKVKEPEGHEPHNGVFP